MTCNHSVQRLFSVKYIYSQTIHKKLGSKVCYSSHLQRSFGSAGNSGYFDVLVVGGGIMGSSTAHWLTKARFKSIYEFIQHIGLISIKSVHSQPHKNFNL